MEGDRDLTLTGGGETTRKRPFVVTEDGSLSCLDKETGELFHNRAGAITEALMNYVAPSGALEAVQGSGSLTVLDACFGLGYNTWVLIAKLIEAGVSNAHVRVVALERDSEVLTHAVHVLEEPRLAAVKETLTQLADQDEPRLDFGRTYSWRCETITGELIVCQSDLREAVPGLHEPFDVVFHDPFSPARMPELWSVDLFRHYHRLLQSHSGRLLTYSSAGAVRGGLREAGFHVWRTAAVGGKSGGTLASINTRCPPYADVSSLNDDEERRLRSRSGIPYRDPSLSDSREAMLARRQAEQLLWASST